MKNKLLALAGALLIGALGSGLWELIKPLLGWVASSSLDIVTLGLESLRDGLYADAAAQESERVSISILAMLTGIIVGAILVLIFPLKKLFPKELGEPEEDTKEALAAYASALQTRLALLKKVRFFFIFSFVIYLTFLMLLTNRVVYVSRVTANFNRTYLVITPYIPPQQIALFRSRFSLVKTRIEYINLIEEMHAIAKQNGITLPQFNIY